MKYTLDMIKNISADELNTMSQEELADFVIQGKRFSEFRRARTLKKIEELDYSLPLAYADFKPSKNSPNVVSYRTMIFGGGSKEEIKKMDIGKLRHEAKIIKSYLNTETSTITGWRSYSRDIVNRFKRYLSKLGYLQDQISAMNLRASYFYKSSGKQFWDVYSKWKEQRGGDFSSYVGGSDQAQLDLYEMFFVNGDTTNLTPEELITRLIAGDVDRYEKQEEQERIEQDYENSVYYSFRKKRKSKIRK